jgi:hypothetical protein
LVVCAAHGGSEPNLPNAASCMNVCKLDPQI